MAQHAADDFPGKPSTGEKAGLPGQLARVRRWLAEPLGPEGLRALQFGGPELLGLGGAQGHAELGEFVPDA